MRLIGWLCALALALGMPVISAAHGQAPTRSARDDDRRIMVMIGLAPEHFRSGGDYSGGYGDPAGQAIRLRLAHKIARAHRLRILENWPMQMIGVDCVIMAIEDDRSPTSVAEAISKLPGVEWSQPLNRFETQSGPAAYNDNLYRAQPAASRWQLADLHRFATGRGVTIAIIDSRIDTAHPDLVGQRIEIEDFVPGNRRAAERHGTGIAGIIAARPNNRMGIAGIAPAARILGLRACWERSLGGATICDSLTLAKALSAALDRHADIINLSLTGPRDRLLSTLIGIGVARGMTVVAAVDAANPDASFPASVQGVIRVGNERMAGLGGTLFLAPGVDIPTTEPHATWGLVSGSSFATAHVSALVALLKQLAGHASMPMTPALGPAGAIDACAAISRRSALDPGSCRRRD